MLPGNAQAGHRPRPTADAVTAVPPNLTASAGQQPHHRLRAPPSTATVSAIAPALPSSTVSARGAPTALFTAESARLSPTALGAATPLPAAVHLPMGGHVLRDQSERHFDRADAHR